MKKKFKLKNQIVLGHAILNKTAGSILNLSIILSLIFSFSPLVVAQAQPSGSNFGRAPATPTQPAPAPTYNSVPTQPAPTTAASQPTNTNNSSGSGMGGAMMQSAISAGVMGMIASESLFKGCPIHQILCVMAAAAGMTAVSMMLTGGSGKNTKNAFQASQGSGFNAEGGNYGPYGSEQGFRTAANNLFSELAKKGYKVDPKNGTVTGPNGKTAKVSALGTGRGALAAGLISAEDVEEYDKAVKEVQDKNKVIAMNIANSAGGGGSAASGSNYNYKYEDPYASLYGDSMKEKPDAPVTEGLTRTLASGDSIGGKTDNIFDMVHRRYQSKKQEDNYFVESQSNTAKKRN